MLNEIHLNNFKKHDQFSAQLDGGLTSLTGANATGKSSILKAILFGMLGATAAGAKDHLWKWGADGTKSVGIAITLPEHGRVLITRTPTGAKVTSEDGRTLASGNTAVTKLIEESLGMAAKDLRTLMYSPQGETQGLLTMGPAMMQQKVESLAQMETIDKVLGVIGRDIDKYNGHLEAVQLTQDPAQLKLEIEKAEQAVMYYQREIDAIRQLEVKELDLLTAAKGLLSDAQAQAQAREKLVAQHGGLWSVSQSLQKDLETVRTQIASIPLPSGHDPAVLEDLIKKAEVEVQDKRQLITYAQQVTKEVASLGQAIGDLQARAAQHDRAVMELEKLQAPFEQVTSEKFRLEETLRELQSELSKKNHALHSATCPTCHRAMEGVDVAAITAEVEDLRGRLATVQREYTETMTVRNDYSATQVALKRQLDPAAKALLEDKQARLAELQAVDLVDIPAVTAELDELEKGLGYTRSDLAKDKQIQSRLDFLIPNEKSLLARIDDNAKEIEKLNEQISAMPIVELDQFEARVRQHQEALDIHRSNKNPFLVNLGQAQSELAGLKSELIKAESAAAELKQVTESKSLAEELQGFLRKNRNRLASDLWDGLLNYSSALISNTTGGVLSGLDRDAKGEFTIKELGREIPVTEASGAQRSIIGLALRVALTKVFYGDKLLLLLDEATADASDETAAAIAGMLSSLNMQVVTVTHRSGDAVNAGTILEIGR